VREAGLDGIEIHAANGYLFTQFLSSAINRRRDDYGGPLENRARLLLDVVRAIRREVGRDFHLQVKLSAVEHNNAFMFWEKPGNTLMETVQVCRWLEAEGVDAIHVSTGSMFLHPLNPPGGFPVDFARRYYGSMMASGRYVFRNYLFFRFRVLSPLFRMLWGRASRGQVIEGLNLPDARAIRSTVSIPVICTGGFQTASVIRQAIRDGDCDAVSIARPLLANPDLPHIFAAGFDKAERPCTYCNKCLIAVLDSPLGCYEEARFDGDRERMVSELLDFFEDAPEAVHEPY
jgi:2,4-dienoyl-CoA reductase (NADPH2)